MPRFRPLPLIAALALPLAASAGVETLSSEEMVDTYIKDSAIIVVPRRQEPAPRPAPRPKADSVIQTITISPGEPVITEAEIERIRLRIQATRNASLGEAETLAEEQLVRDTLNRPLDRIAALQPNLQTPPALPNLIFGQRPDIPDQPFTETFLNNQLGLNFDGQNLTFAIGNPPGINQINVPQAINEGPVQLIPRPGGGFDLKIAVPEAR